MFPRDSAIGENRLATWSELRSSSQVPASGSTGAADAVVVGSGVSEGVERGVGVEVPGGVGLGVLEVHPTSKAATVMTVAIGIKWRIAIPSVI